MECVATFYSCHEHIQVAYIINVFIRLKILEIVVTTSINITLIIKYQITNDKIL